MSRKLSLLMIVVLLAGMFLMPATAGAEAVVTDGEQTAAPRYSHRLIVELTSPPLALYEGGAAVSAAGGKIDVNSPAAQQYIQQLQAEQQAFVAAMSRAVPGAQVATFINESGVAVPATYQVLLNAVSVDAGRGANLQTLERQLRRLPGVLRVSKDWAHDPAMYASLPLINAPAAWDNAAIGGKSNAGAGIKFASMDGGVHKDAPMFDGAGYTYPAGFPKGDIRGTNGKIIVARAYFRTWDPPSAGDENVWPGTRTAAGDEVQASYLGAAPVTLSGVAPKAYVMSYRVFYNSITNDGSFYNTEGIKALEDIVKDGADVLNNSWGGGPGSLGGEFDALDTALINAVKAGIFVSMSNGNAGPNPGTGDHPSSEYINVAASTTTGTYASGRLKVSAPEPVPADLTSMSYGTAQFGAPLPVGMLLGPYGYIPAEVVAPTNIEGCSAFPEDAFAGQAALIRRGTCNFSLKVLNAQNAGASFVVIYNQAAAGDTLVNMAAGDGADQVTISSVIVGNTNGGKLVDWYATNGAAAQLVLDTVAYQVGNTPDIIANFSSRGPGVGNVLKPDIAAPGVNILSQGFAPGVTGEARHLGFGQASGTSMAAPHVAGAAALIKQIHPAWSPAWIKSALMSTSKYLDIYNQNGTPAQPLDMGAGRLDLTNAANPGVILDPPSLSFGQVEMGAVKTIEVKVTSVAASTETYEVRTLYTGLGFGSLTTVDGMTVSPASITLAPGETATLTVTWDTAQARGAGDNQGYVLLDGATYDAHMPAWVRVTEFDPERGDVLIIDNDASSSLGFDDYVSYYTEALDELGVTYDVWDADEQAGNPVSIPDAAYLAQYKAIIYETGDNFYPNGSFTVPTPPTTADMDRLVEYWNGGGHIIAFGQDLAAVTGGSSSSVPFFYAATLGANYLQDSVNGEILFDNSVQLLTGAPGTPFSNLSFDISLLGDGAGSNYYMDEIGSGCSDPDDTFCPVTPLLKYSVGGNNVEEGYVALANRDYVTLERPGVSNIGKAVYFSFGLEGVNSDTGFNTRAELLAAALSLGWDEATAAIDADVKPVGDVSYFTATMDSTYGGDGVSFRWDFGDGTPLTNYYASATAGHTYAQGGDYVVRVEAVNALGTHAIAELPVSVAQVYTQPATDVFPAAADTYIHSGLQTSNYGTSPVLYVGHNDVNRTILRFDVSSIDPNYPVEKAVLSVHVNAYSGGGSPADMQVFELTRAWVENTATWRIPWTVRGGDFDPTPVASLSIERTEIPKFMQFDITPLVQKWVADPASNNGVIIRLQNQTSVTLYRLGSKEYWDKSQRPSLEVQYLKP
ncbi:MAG: Minor extracellular protease vpr precursor [Chloroflexi bacterium ADurb.Bin325]|nr:MAG: Minor extracellular protease vpr precursor [Chloroflexi bacterium ADurb.Bin325]